MPSWIQRLETHNEKCCNVYSPRLIKGVFFFFLRSGKNQILEFSTFYLNKNRSYLIYNLLSVLPQWTVQIIFIYWTLMSQIARRKPLWYVLRTVSSMWVTACYANLCTPFHLCCQKFQFAGAAQNSCMLRYNGAFNFTLGNRKSDVIIMNSVYLSKRRCQNVSEIYTIYKFLGLRKINVIFIRIGN